MFLHFRDEETEVWEGKIVCLWLCLFADPRLGPDGPTPSFVIRPPWARMQGSYLQAIIGQICILVQICVILWWFRLHGKEAER